ncbi:unnamed protein product, partial [Medioppia subpectinata]
MSVNNERQQNSEHNILTDIQNGIRETINKAMNQMEDIKNKTDKTVFTINTLEDELSQHKSNLQNLETNPVNFTTISPTELDKIPGDNNERQQNSEHNILTDIQNGIRETINKAMDQMEDIKNKTDKTVFTINTLEDELSQHKSNLQNLETKFENVK